MIKRFRVRLHGPEWQTLLEAASDANLSVNVLMRRAIREYLERRRYYLPPYEPQETGRHISARKLR